MDMRRPDLTFITTCNEDLFLGIQLFEKYGSVPHAPLWRAEGVYNVNKMEIDELRDRLATISSTMTYSTDFVELQYQVGYNGPIAKNIKAGWDCLAEIITPEIVQEYWERLEAIQKRFNAMPPAPEDTEWIWSLETPYKNFQQGWSHWNVASWGQDAAYNLYMCDCFFKNVEYILELREELHATLSCENTRGT